MIMSYSPGEVFAPIRQLHEQFPSPSDIVSTRPFALLYPDEYLTLIEYKVFGMPLIAIVALPPRLTAPGDCVTVIEVATIGGSVDKLVNVDCALVVVATSVVTGGGIVSGLDAVDDFVVVSGFVTTEYVVTEFVVTGSVIGSMISAVLDLSDICSFCVVVIDFWVKTLVV